MIKIKSNKLAKNSIVLKIPNSNSRNRYKSNIDFSKLNLETTLSKLKAINTKLNECIKRK